MRRDWDVKSDLSKDKELVRDHSEICCCEICMKSKMPTGTLSDREQHALRATMVNRRDPDHLDKPLMQAAEAHGILRPGSEVDMQHETGILASELPDGYAYIQPTEPRELTIKARWRPASEEHARSGRDASVFGGLGVLLIPKNISVVDIPKMNALAVPKEFLHKYGAELIPLAKPFLLDPVEHKELEELFLVQYNFDEEYVKQYALKEKGGGGLFVETHPFPHVFTPLAKECHGALILGVKRKDGQFDFAAFEIPFGFTLKVQKNVIHGDSFFVGPYAIALTETDLADSVLFKQDTPDRDIEAVEQVSLPVAPLPLLAEYRLAKEVNNYMMVEKIRHEGVDGKGLGFFRSLPNEVLSEVHTMSQEADEAFHERVKSSK